ncbi:MAG: ABC transporter ATP-binding protein [Actinomycetota bacterium]|nr:ABC transporter ATP-binding protein [Actinomycetota bacterium]
MQGVAEPAKLAVRDLSKHFGGLRAVDGVSFTVDGGEVLGVVGPNGAGKTTLFDVVTGLRRATRGDVLLDDVSLARASVHRRCHLGIVRTFQQPTLAGSMSVRENVLLGCYFGRPSAHWRELPADPEDHADALLALTGLTDRGDRIAGPLGVFDKKRTMLASALAAGPRVLLLDEPFGGLNPSEIDATLELISSIRALGVAIVCIEHVMRALVQLADRVLVMHHGATLFAGSAEEMLADRRVIDVYLGRGGNGGGAQTRG